MLATAQDPTKVKGRKPTCCSDRDTGRSPNQDPKYSFSSLNKSFV